ncbi:MAG TPA: helix-turn-helix domain-containing protein [Solirubrobacteraceae bacterium]|nr:helix-turn-helix domain-containing protein [Solirubrobacteraceae bacterium]
MDGKSEIEHAIGSPQAAGAGSPYDRGRTGADRLPAPGEDGFPAAFDAGVARLSAALVQAWQGEELPLERVRAGLLVLLAFLDGEPAWGRLLVIDALAAGADVLERRQRALAALIEVLDREAGRSATPLPSSRLMAEGVVGAIFAVIHARMLEPDGGPLAELTPALMSLIVLPYLGRGGAGVELAPAQAAVGPAGETPSRAAQLPIRATYRTTLVLRAIDSAPESSNREIARAAGLADEGQTSRLLRRLERRGLVRNVGLGQAYGEPNAWLLTPHGRRLAELSGYGLALGAPAAGGGKVREAA